MAPNKARFHSESGPLEMAILRVVTAGNLNKKNRG
jgi:hypothetical protein